MLKQLYKRQTSLTPQDALSTHKNITRTQSRHTVMITDKQSLTLMIKMMHASG